MSQIRPSTSDFVNHRQFGTKIGVHKPKRFMTYKEQAVTMVRSEAENSYGEFSAFRKFTVGRRRPFATLVEIVIRLKEFPAHSSHNLDQSWFFQLYFFPGYRSAQQHVQVFATYVGPVWSRPN